MSILLPPHEALAYRPQYFTLKELVDPKLLETISEELAWRLVPVYALQGLDKLRALLGAPIFINGRGATQRGIRTLTTTIGAPRSGHKGFRGETCFDLVTSTPEDLLKLEALIKKFWRELGIGRLEDPQVTKTWLHIAFTAQPPKTLQIFKP